MPASVAHTHRNSAEPPAPGKRPVAFDDISHGHFLRLLQTTTLTLMILGVFLSSGTYDPGSLPQFRDLHIQDSWRSHRRSVGRRHGGGARYICPSSPEAGPLPSRKRPVPIM
jgi:hypothetical protein